jgi:hypothetical protein
MIPNQGQIIDGLVDDLLETIHRYDESLHLSTVVGCLEFVKQQLMETKNEQS